MPAAVAASTPSPLSQARVGTPRLPHWAPVTTPVFTATSRPPAVTPPSTRWGYRVQVSLKPPTKDGFSAGPTAPGRAAAAPDVRGV